MSEQRSKALRQSEVKQAVYGIKEKQLSASRGLTLRAGTLTALVTADLSEKPSICKQQVKLRMIKVPVQSIYEHQKEYTLKE